MPYNTKLFHNFGQKLSTLLAVRTTIVVTSIGVDKSLKMWKISSFNLPQQQKVWKQLQFASSKIVSKSSFWSALDELEKSLFWQIYSCHFHDMKSWWKWFEKWFSRPVIHGHLKKGQSYFEKVQRWRWHLEAFDPVYGITYMTLTCHGTPEIGLLETSSLKVSTFIEFVLQKLCWISI